MKHNQHPHGPSSKPAKTPPAATPVALNAGESAFVPSPDEVARRAYFAYENQGSLPGQEVQHWLQAEADLIAERNQTRVHGFHTRN